jgi:hypothetical protein
VARFRPRSTATRHAQHVVISAIRSFRKPRALNLYSDEPGAFSEDSFLIGEILAQHAAVAMIGAAAETQFENALATRDVIGQAKGMLMQRDNLTGLQAFSLLTRASQQTNIKLSDVARWLVNEHESKLEDHSTRHS